MVAVVFRHYIAVGQAVRSLVWSTTSAVTVAVNLVWFASTTSTFGAVFVVNSGAISAVSTIATTATSPSGKSMSSAFSADNTSLGNTSISHANAAIESVPGNGSNLGATSVGTTADFSTSKRTIASDDLNSDPLDTSTVVGILISNSDDTLSSRDLTRTESLGVTSWTIDGLGAAANSLNAFVVLQPIVYIGVDPTTIVTTFEMFVSQTQTTLLAFNNNTFMAFTVGSISILQIAFN